MDITLDFDSSNLGSIPSVPTIAYKIPRLKNLVKITWLKVC